MQTEAFFQKLAGRLKIPGGKILTYDEIQQWPPGMREELEKAGMIRQIEPAAEVICNQCEERCLIIPNSLRTRKQKKKSGFMYVLRSRI